MRRLPLRANLSRDSLSKAGNCRKSLTSMRDRRNTLAERLDKQWRELRRHVTIEKDPELTAEFARRKRQREAVDKLSDRV
jgi:hypothetical protein